MVESNSVHRDGNNQTDKNMYEIIRVFSEEYVPKLFYFCLKKTGNSFDAEDLTSDISVNILSSLNRDIFPENFSAWVWQIARNRYSSWAKNKKRRSQNVAASDIDDFEIQDNDTSIEDELINSEQLSLLRRELAFISSDCRNIVVEHYIKNRKINDIAASLGLPKGTVLTRLSRARKILKEGRTWQENSEN